MAAGDKITEAFRLLITCVGVVLDPSLLGAAKAGPGVLDSIRKLATAPPLAVRYVSDRLAAQARALFDATSERPADADVLYADMIEIGSASAIEIVAAGMNPEALTEAMLAKLTDREHRTEEMRALFRQITTPVLHDLLADNTFAEALRAAFMQEVLRQLGDLSARLERVDRLTRLEMVALGDRFDIVGMHSLSDAELREALEKRADDWRALKAQIEAIDERTAGLGSLKAAAREAVERLDFEEVEALLARVDELETEIAAKTKVLRGDNALLRGRVEQAFTIFSAAADSFASLDRLGPVYARLECSHRLYAHGLSYGGTGLAFAERMIRHALKDLLPEDEPALRAGLLRNLGTALHVQGARVGGPKGAALLEEAAESYRVALRDLTAASHQEDWAATQNNLGNVLQVQAAWLGGQTDIALLKKAVQAYEDALRVWTERAFPAQWAFAQSNLGASLATLGMQFDGPEGTGLLGKAIKAYRAALRVQTEREFAGEWASTQNNLGIALRAQGERLGGQEGHWLLLEALTTYQAALRVRTEEVLPVDWAKTTVNHGLANESLAENATCTSPRAALEAAVKCFTEALRVLDPETLSHDHLRATASLARVRAKLAALPDPA